MTANRSSNVTRAPKRRRSLAGVWIAVFVSLGLLAALGIRGLQRDREAILDQARATSFAVSDRAARSVGTSISEKTAGGRLLRLFPDVPEPGNDSGVADVFETALSRPPAEAESTFSAIERDHPDAVTAAGLPVLPLIAWIRLERSDGDGIAQADALARKVIEEAPSLLSETLLEKAGALLSARGSSRQTMERWMERWREDESIRAVLRSLQPPNPIAQWIDVPGHGGWWTAPVNANTWRLTSLKELQTLADMAAADALPLLPANAKLSVAWAGRNLLPAANGETLAQRDQQNLSIRVILADLEGLFRDHHRQSRWMAALLALALISVLSAFVAMQRSLASERLLNQQKSDFVASVSHELRAPVSSMRLMLENLQGGVTVAESSRADYLRLMEGECRRLSALIENVLDFARIEHNRKSYEMVETDVKAMLEDVVRLFEPRVAQRRQRLITQLETLDPAPEVDALALQQAVINLLDNAVKFSPDGTAITISTKKRDAATWEISVTDEGPGIPAQDRERIFERFYRVGNELRRETPGAGIGLAIVKHTVDAHHGRIEVDCNPHTTFRLILPFTPPKP